MPVTQYTSKPIITFADSTSILRLEFLQTTVEIYDIEGSAHDDAKEAMIATPRLQLFSSGYSTRNKTSDCNELIKFYADPDNVKLYANGKVIGASTVCTRFRIHTHQWHTGNIFSSFIMNDESGNTIGQTFQNAIDEDGASEFGIMIDKKYQGSGYGTEATMAHSYFWLPYIKQNENKYSAHRLTSIVATAHPDNGTAKIFERLNFNLNGAIHHEVYNAPRNIYSLPLATAIQTVANTRNIIS